MSSKEGCRDELRIAVRQLSDRGLSPVPRDSYCVASYEISAHQFRAAEQVVAIEIDELHFTPSNTRFQSGSSSIRRRYRTNEIASTPTAGVSYVSTPVMEEDELVNGDFYVLAKLYFDRREYRRAAHVLRDQMGKKSIFLRCYALFLAGEKRKEEEMIEVEDSLGKSGVVNGELAYLERELSILHKNGSIDPFGLYLYGLVLKEKGNESMSRTILVESVNSYPWNWSAWSELQSLCSSMDMLRCLSLKNHWMKEFFLAAVSQDLRMHPEALSKYEHLQGIFSYSNYILAQIAKVHYSLIEFEAVEVIFEELSRNDPYRVEDMDLYSNVLYVKECSSVLSYLAHKIFTIDKYGPESCCIIGNYYSLKGEHEKSVLYFKRALKLNRKYLSAWTLIGHEYIEMKNIAAAIEAYRRAVDLSPCDYRAWYGLGQAYEILNMPYYALHYFRKSVFLQPRDSRLWIAMAQCYESEQLRMLKMAIKCYKRAVNCDDREAIALNKLGNLHRELGRTEEAAFFFKKDLERMDADQREGPNMIEALMFLATDCRDQHKFEEAEVYCTRYLEYNGPENEKAKSLLRGIRSKEGAGPSMDADHFPL